MEFFDAHAHYDDERFDTDRESIITDIYNSGVTKIVSAGYSLQGSWNNLELAKKYDFIYTTVGISPNDLGENWKQDIASIKELLEQNLKLNKIVAVGEIGLDFHYDTDKEIQREAFKMQIDIANEYNLPIVIHTREAVYSTLEILKSNPANNKGMFHCCPLNRELVKEALKLGYYISMAGPVTFRNAKYANEIIGMVPLDRFLIETDSPYLAPDPVRGTRNNSRNLKYIVQKIASVKNMSEEEIAAASYQNAETLFRLKQE